MVKAKTTTPETILLGDGVFYIGENPIGLTRGGGEFNVEREIRNITADGDMGQVKGRIALDGETAKLKFNSLEFLSETEIKAFYPGLDVTGLITTSKLAFTDADYHDVKWVGKNLKGRGVTITVKNALNVGGLSFALADKSEVVPEFEYTGSYDEENRKASTWSITWADEGGAGE